MTDPGHSIIPTGFQGDVCRIDALAGEREDLARSIHGSYREFKGANERASEDLPENDQPWDLLKQTYRIACRRAADHFPIKLLSIGMMHRGAPFVASEKLAFASTAHVESLAELEHNSWIVDRRLDGWRVGDHRDNQARIHPALVPYAQLPEDMKDFDRDQILAIAEHLLQKDQTSPTVKRELRLGIFGHNKVSHDEKTSILQKLDQSVWPGLREWYERDVVSVCTPLAPGADTILTEAVLERLRRDGVDHRLIVIRTLPVSTVIEDFKPSFSADPECDWRLKDEEPTDDWAAARRQMADHLASIPTSVPAAYVADLTPPGLAVDDFEKDHANRTRAYRRAGAWLVERCDYLIVYHDSGRGAGEGGTRETLQWARGESFIPPDLTTLNPGEEAKRPRVKLVGP